MTIGSHDAPVCRTCAVQYPPGAPPDICVICADERQWVPSGGQQWTTLHELHREGHRIDVRELEPDLLGVGVTPSLGIGQRGCLIRTPKGNLLWDCVGYIDDEAVAAIGRQGGLAGIAASHPHFYGAMVEWSSAFDGAPLFVPSADREWVVRTDTDIVWWSNEIEPLEGLHLIQCGGHFDGSAVLAWPAGAEGRGALFVGDTATVTSDREFVSFMRSYPNLIPLPAPTVRDLVARATRHPFDRVYGGWWDRVIAADGYAAFERSLARYLRWIDAD